MRKIVISTQSSLLASMLVKEQKLRGTQTETLPGPAAQQEIMNLCRSIRPEILVMEVSYIAPFTFEERMDIAGQVKKEIPDCRIALLCDENANPKIAEKIIAVKKAGLIESFFYTSVSVEYLTAALDSM